MSQPSRTPHADREPIISTSVAAAAAATLAGLAAPAQAAEPKQPLYRISLAEWSLVQIIRAGQLDNRDFAKTSKEDYGIDAIEYVNQFFMDKAQDQAYLTDLKKRADDLGVKTVLIMIDNEGDLGAPKLAERLKTVDKHKKWVEAAKFLGGHSIRVNARSVGSYEDQMSRAADGLRAITEFGDQHGINVIVENHGGLSSNGKWLAAVIKKVDHPRCGTLPDFTNFNVGQGEPAYDKYQGVAELMPFAKGVSAASGDFDENGNDARTDFRKMIKIVLDAGYHGYLGIEYKGRKLSPPEGVKATKKLLEKIRDEMSA